MDDNSGSRRSFPGLKALLDLKLRMKYGKGLSQASEEELEEAIEEIYNDEISEVVAKRLREESISSNVIWATG
ncbi:MAG: hypothetical protein GSR72_00505 [Desulfurococcales archaeon]|nr:hypothetical protein [Desulfurococcales archaeon]MEB3788358.1 hypothetical protein [Desulfurococcales archaeon]